MRKILNFILITIFVNGISTFLLRAQMQGLHGDDREYKRGLHSANMLRLSFFNDGTYGANNNSKAAPNYGGEWPINSGHFYLLDGDVYVLSEVFDNVGDTKGTKRHIQSTVKSLGYQDITVGDKDPTSDAWWTFLPLPGFARPGQDKLAMAKGGAEWGTSWPDFWPDIKDPSDKRTSPDGWAGSWNGYFGRDIFNADEEAYFIADDYAKQEFPNFRPDMRDLNRGGLGIRLNVRSFAWSKTLVEDAIFCLFDLKNIGTYPHSKVVFGYKIGNNVGETLTIPNADQDGGEFDRELNLAWTYDDDGIGGWSPGVTGLFGGAFLESPGNPFDGIDNDNDGKNGSGDQIAVSMFNSHILQLDDPIVIINYNSYSRQVTTLRDTLTKLGKAVTDTLIINFSGYDYKFWAGDTIKEDSINGANSFDDNLNGLIDESRGASITRRVFNYLYIENGVGYKCINYFTGAGKDNLLIDERRDDGIDNNGDWNPLTDDVGSDGVGPDNPKYLGPDVDGSERNGRPDAGEPHFDMTDIYESDMLGLTSFELYNFSGGYKQSQDEATWQMLLPGYFRTTITPGNIELMYGSGFFPLPPGNTERFSMGLIAGDGGTTGKDITDLVKNKENVQLAYAGNYNFSKAPDIPTVRAVVGDKKVTLFWDKVAESSVDPVSSDPGGRDFEGYRIYRSTYPDWSDASPITNAQGTSGTLTPLYRRPIAQFDIENDYSGYAAVYTEGVHFWLGNNTGLQHYWVDTNVVNGQTYYYAVTSYDHGEPSKKIDPSECSKFVALSTVTGGVEDKGKNVVVVKPEAPSAGFIPANLNTSGIVLGSQNTSQGTLNFNVVEPDSIRNNHTYRITFRDIAVDTADVNGKIMTVKATQDFTLIDKTSNDTLLLNNSLEGDTYEGLPIIQGFKLEFTSNPGLLLLNRDSSGWSREGILNYDIIPYRFTGQMVELIPNDFEIIFGEVGIDSSEYFRRGIRTLPAIPVNFTVFNKHTKRKVDFAFFEQDTLNGDPDPVHGSRRGVFSFRNGIYDQIIFLTKADSPWVASWSVVLSNQKAGQGDTLLPGAGDVLTLKLNKPFLPNDTLWFTTIVDTVIKELAEIQMDRIRVVPNPYIVTNSWEPKNPYISELRERQLHFTHLPAKCTIRIFNIRGQLIKTLEHNNSIDNGTEVWNMLSKDNLEISYGIYIYHVQAEGIGEKIGKFVVLK